MCIHLGFSGCLFVFTYMHTCAISVALKAISFLVKGMCAFSGSKNHVYIAGINKRLFIKTHIFTWRVLLTERN